MDLEYSFFKFFNFIIIISLLSKINSFEYLPNWENNKIESNLTEILLDSEIQQMI